MFAAWDASSDLSTVVAMDQTCFYFNLYKYIIPAIQGVDEVPSLLAPFRIQC